MKSQYILSAAVLTASLSLVACDNSSSSSSGYECSVSETATTVTITQSLSGVASYTERGVLNGNRIDFVEETYYNDSELAREMCNEAKDEAEEWRDGSVHVTCSGNTVTRTDYSETTDIAGYAAEQRYQCEEMKRRYESGSMWDEDDDW